MPIIIENLSYIYNPKAAFRKTALTDINLRIEDGDFFGIIGHTGSGKSTLIGHLNGLIKLTSGSIKVDDIDLSAKYDYKKLRSKVGMLFQYPEHQLFDETVRRDVGFGCRNLGINAQETEERVKNAIKLVGLSFDEIAERSPFELSGGQMRRVALAGVLAMRPQVLVLDEPTAGLDPHGKKQVLSLIHEVKKQCPTVIMISHNMDEIFENCNRIALLVGGRLRGVFTPSELYQNSELVRECGLEMPTAFALAYGLNSAGYHISSITDEDDLINQIATEYTAKTSGANSKVNSGANYSANSKVISSANSNAKSNAKSDVNTNINSNANDNANAKSEAASVGISGTNLGETSAADSETRAAQTSVDIMTESGQKNSNKGGQG